MLRGVSHLEFYCILKLRFIRFVLALTFFVIFGNGIVAKASAKFDYRVTQSSFHEQRNVGSSRFMISDPMSMTTQGEANYWFRQGWILDPQM